MNWIILVIAALFEVGFASCLGKAKKKQPELNLTGGMEDLSPALL